MAENENVYDVNKKYTWGPEDTFQLSGRNFGLVLNALRSVFKHTRSCSNHYS